VLDLVAARLFKIPKSVGVDKAAKSPRRWPNGRFFLVLTAVFSSYFSGFDALALPVTIAWDLPLIHAETYLLELSGTPGFAETIIKIEVKGTGYTGEVPAEGVYHWRLSRPGITSTNQEGVETSIFASGSFVVLDPDVKRLSPPRVTWDKVDQAERYKVYLLGPNANQRVVTVAASSFTVPTVDEATMLEVIPFTEGRRTTRGYRMDPSLTLLSGAIAPPAGTPPLAPAAAAVVAAAPIVTTEVRAAPRRRRSLVYVFGDSSRERMQLQKLELDLVSSTKPAGGGGGFWLNPTHGMILSGQADYHEHADKQVRQTDLFPDRKLTLNQSRYNADLNVGYNLLDFFGVQRVVFAVAASAAVLQLPLVDVESAVAPPTPPTLSKTRLSLLGGQASIGYLGSYVGLLLEGGALFEATSKGRLYYERLLLDIYLGPVVSLELGVFNRDLEAKRCAKDPTVCLAVGASSFSSRETAILLGLGIVMF